MIAVIAALLVWGFVHSLLAGQAPRHWVRQRFGERAYHGFYRLGYNFFAGLSILPVLALMAALPRRIVWEIDPNLSFILLIIQAIGVIGLLISVAQIDGSRFLGLSQLRAYLTGAPLPLPDEKLQTGGIYAITRHPLYLFSLLTIWPMPRMSDIYLGFALAATLYFIVGSLYEERRMVNYFGQEYLDYRARVPWMLPLPRFADKT